MNKFTTIAASALVAIVAATSAFAQTPAPQPKAAAPAVKAAAPMAPAATAPAPAAGAAKAAKAAKGGKPKAERTSESLACSAKADEMGLKGKAKSKERKSFRNKCMKDMKAAAAGSAPAAAKAPMAAKAPAMAPAPSAPAAAAKKP